MITFQEFPKIPRLRRELTVTEKIDGTNAAIQIAPVEESTEQFPFIDLVPNMKDQHGVSLGRYGIWAQSRSKFITPEQDNYGFAGWVKRNAEELSKLGPGIHYGEWWGNGIQRRYDQAEKRFSLFNAMRWGDHNPPPACCSVVPILGRDARDSVIQNALDDLRTNGSRAAPGFMKPEGVIVWHSAARSYFKVLLEGDEAPKGSRNE
jgi:RNA ligase